MLLHGKQIQDQSIKPVKIDSLGYTPAADNDLTTVQYVSALLGGLKPKSAVQVATTGNIDLAVAITTLDGYTLQDGDRVLVKDQSNGIENGVYAWESGTQLLSRAADFDDAPTNEVSLGTYVFVAEGALFGGFGFFISGSDSTSTDGDLAVGTHTQVWSISAKATSYLAGTGVTFNGNEIAVDGASLAGAGIGWQGDQFVFDAANVAGNGLVENAGKLDWSGNFSGNVNLGGTNSRVTLSSSQSSILSRIRLDGSSSEWFTGNGTLSVGSSIQSHSSFLSLRYVNNSDIERFTITPNGLVYEGQHSISYAADYSANYTARSLVDKAYVDDAIIASQVDVSALAGNGLTPNGGQIDLGGALSAPVTINTSGGSFAVENSGTRMSMNSVSTFRITNNTFVDKRLQIDDAAIAIAAGDFGTSEKRLVADNSGISFQSDDSTWRGVRYDRDYYNYFTDRSLVDKAYVDREISAAAQGLAIKEAVRVATAANIDLATGGLLTIDGITLVAGDRVLVKNQTDATQNGIYIAAAGAWARATDMDEAAEFTRNGFVFVSEGTTLADTGWTMSGPDAAVTVGTSAIQWTQFSSAGVITAGAGLTKTGNTLSVDGASLAGTGIAWFGSQFSLDTNVIAGEGLTFESGQLHIGGNVTDRLINVNATSGGFGITDAPEDNLFNDNFLWRYSRDGFRAYLQVAFQNRNDSNDEIIDITYKELPGFLRGGRFVGYHYSTWTDYTVPNSNSNLRSATTRDDLQNNTTLGYYFIPDGFKLIAGREQGSAGADYKFEFEDKRASKVGIQYIGFGEASSTDATGADYSTLVDTSLVPKAYVDDAIIASQVDVSALAGNGLTQNTTTGALDLGGTISSNVTLTGTNSTLFLADIPFMLLGKSTNDDAAILRIDGRADVKTISTECDSGTYGAMDRIYTGLTNSFWQVILNGGSSSPSVGIFAETSSSGGTIETKLEVTGTDITYADDYSANFTDRSLVDKAYVDNLVSSSIAAPYTGNRGQNPTASVGTDDHDTGIALAKAPKGLLIVAVNGQIQRVATADAGRATSAFYFGAAAGTAKSFGDLASGDKLYYNPTVAGYDLDANDTVDIYYI